MNSPPLARSATSNDEAVAPWYARLPDSKSLTDILERRGVEQGAVARRATLFEPESGVVAFGRKDDYWQENFSVGGRLERQGKLPKRA
jgi:hypothetical protein